MKVLVVDVGGTHVKVLASGQTESRKFDSGPALDPRTMVRGVKKITRGWEYDACLLAILDLCSTIGRWQSRTTWERVGLGSILKLLFDIP
jgi:hypothetical protein